MNNLTQELVDLLTLEKLEEHIFRGKSLNLVGKRVFGGQVLGQALRAASYTTDRPAHSLHAYFLFGGDVNVTGTLLPGFSVIADNLTVTDIEDGEVNVENNAISNTHTNNSLNSFCANNSFNFFIIFILFIMFLSVQYYNNRVF